MNRKNLRNQRGTSAIEYALLIALLSVGSITSFSSVNGSINSSFNRFNDALNSPYPTVISPGASGGGDDCAVGGDDPGTFSNAIGGGTCTSTPIGNPPPQPGGWDPGGD